MKKEYKFKVGDEVEYDINFSDSFKFTDIYIIEEVNYDEWIWSSQFPTPYMEYSFKKNYHNPLAFKISKRQLREIKLKDIGIV
jgi:hypothetical protein